MGQQQHNSQPSQPKALPAPAPPWSCRLHSLHFHSLEEGAQSNPGTLPGEIHVPELGKDRVESLKIRCLRRVGTDTASGPHPIPGHLLGTLSPPRVVQGPPTHLAAPLRPCHACAPLTAALATPSAGMLRCLNGIHPCFIFSSCKSLGTPVFL